MRLLAVGAVLAGSIFGRSARAQVLPTRVDLKSPAPDSFLVSLETTKGPVVLKARR
jgi:hypothetical protein